MGPARGMPRGGAGPRGGMARGGSRFAAPTFPQPPMPIATISEAPKENIDKPKPIMESGSADNS